MRLSGLASGMDTDLMVSEMMKAERLKLDKFGRSKQTDLWKQAEYQKVNKNIANFILNSQKNMGLKKTSSTGLMMNQSYKTLDYMRTAKSSDKEIAEAKVIGKAENGTFDLNIEKLAESSFFTTDAITDINAKIEVADGESIQIAGVTVFEGSENGGKGITGRELLKKINSHKDLKDKNVTAFYDSGTKSIFLQGDASLDLAVNKVANDGTSSSVYGRKDGKAGETGSAVINGVKFENLTNNKLKFNGLEIEMKKTGKTSITVDTNYDEIVDKIKGLVNEYNTLLDDMSKTIGQKRYKDYHPLSAEEKSAMKENDVKLWEEKAKSGLLNNDETLKRMLNNTRSDMYKTVQGLEGSFNHITQIGITTEKYAKGTTGGKLQIDEKKLREALAEDPDGVMELLFGKGKEENLVDGKKGLEAGETFNGVFTGIYDNMVNSMKDVIAKSGPGEDSDLLRDVRSNILIDFVSYKGSISDLDRSIMNMEKKMADMEVLLARKEDGYYKKFTAMEKGLQKMQSQSSWIGQQMM